MIQSLIAIGRSCRHAWQAATRGIEGRLTWRTLLLLGLCVLTAVLVSSGALHASLLRMLGTAQAVIQQYPIAGVAAVIVFAAVSAIFAFLSSALIVPLAVLTWGNASTIAML